MANVQAAVRALAQIDLPLDDLVARINDVIYHNTSPDKFITAFFALLDPAASSLSYVNAGHNPPLLFVGTEVQQLTSGGVILGIMPSIIPYQVGTATMSTGDLLLLYTDGVSEAFNAGLEEYGEARLKALFSGDCVISAAQAVERLREDVFAFAGEARQSDDITIVALRKA
jgi:sigma-B regulation protein RsbU (phosphoserine phosphatase)